MERLFLRVASIDSDSEDKLEKFLMAHLVEAVGFASSRNSEVQKTAIEFLSHVNKRLRSNQSVSLPVEQLLQQYSDPDRANYSENFLVIYLKMGFSRLSESSKINLLPKMIESLDGKSRTHQVELFGVILPTLAVLKERRQDQWPDLGLESHPSLRRALLEYISHVLLLPPQSRSSHQVVDGSNGQEEISVPPGLSQLSYNEVKSFQQSSAALDKLKCGLLGFLCGAKLSPEEVALPFVVAMSDGSHSVVSAGEVAWKKEFGSGSYELGNKSVLLKLFQWYLGTKNSKTLDEKKKIEPANLRQRLKLMGLLKRSPSAAQSFPQNIEVVFNTLFGSEGTPLKLKVWIVEFISVIVDATEEKALGTVCPLLFSALKKQLDTTNDNDAHLVAQTYNSLGKVGSKCPSLVTRDMAMVQTLFDSIKSQEAEEVKSAMIECLTAWIPLFADSSGPLRGVVEAFATSYLLSENPKTRMLALKYVEHIFDPRHIPSRWNLIVASCDSHEEMRREATRILDGSIQTGSLPCFLETVAFFHTQTAQKTDSLSSLSFAVRFLYACLCKEAGMNAEEYQEISEAHSPKIVKFVRGGGRGEWLEGVERLGDVVWTACLQHPKSEYFVLMTVLLWCSPDRIRTTVDLQWLKGCVLGGSNIGVCLSGAELFSWTVWHSSDMSVEQEMGVVLSSIESVSVDRLSVGEIGLVGYLAGRCKEEERGKGVGLLLRAMEPRKPSLLLEVSLRMLGEVLRTSETRPIKKETLLILTELAGSRKESVKAKMRERAVEALGLANCDGEWWEDVSQALFPVGEGPPQMELEFSVGVALMNGALGKLAPARRNPWTEEEEDFFERFSANTHKDHIAELLNIVLTDKLMSPNRHLRQAALIWLFALTKSCSKWHPAIIDHLDECQMAFIDGLAESDDFTQDVASKGLGVVYENGTETQRKRMVDLLVGSLDSGRKLAKPITGDTKIFEKDAVGKTPTGESLSTYKELCSLATEMNKPDLVYKFMQLANHNALWNSKKGAAFGFSAVFKQAREELEPYLGQILPKLYRYQYDPQHKVRAAMRSIWQVITAHKKGVVDEYAEEILSELIPCLTHREWRVRESSCLALSDLLSGHCDERMSKRLPELWDILLRVMDDIKESVRLAAQRALTVLHKVTMRFCSKHRGQRASDLLGLVLPVLLDKGLKSGAKDAKAISLHALMGIGKESGKELRPYMGVLVPSLLESLSEVEPILFNYLAVRSSGAEQEELDSARAAAAKSSPIMDTLRECVRVMDAESVRAVCPGLGDMLRTGVGLGSRTGASTLILAIATHCPKELRESQSSGSSLDKLLRALSSGLQDRNGTVRKQYANTMGYLAPFCGKEALKGMLRKLKANCTDSGASGTAKESSALVLQSLGRRSPDVLKEFGPEIAPFVFLATMTDYKNEAESVTDWKAVWEEIWSELTPGTEGGIRLYKREILKFLRNLLEENPSWRVKADAGRGVQKVVTLIGKDLDITQAEELLETLLNSLSGRTWDGKEEILGALGDTLTHCTEQLKCNLQSDKVNEVVVRECKKRRVDYRTAAVECAGKTGRALGCPSLTLLLPLTLPYLSQEEDLYPSDAEEKETEKSERRILFACTALDALSSVASYSISEEQVGSCVALIVKLLTGSSFWKVRKASLGFIQRILTKAPDLVSNDDKSALFLAVSDCVENCVQESVRKAGLETLRMIGEALESSDEIPSEVKIFAQRLISEGIVTTEEKVILNVLNRFILE